MNSINTNEKGKKEIYRMFFEGGLLLPPMMDTNKIYIQSFYIQRILQISKPSIPDPFNQRQN